MAFIYLLANSLTICKLLFCASSAGDLDGLIPAKLCTFLTGYSELQYYAQ